MNMNRAETIYTFLKNDKSKIFEGGHDVHTPQELVEEILNQVPGIADDKNILVLFNIEFAVSLVYTLGVNSSNITFYSDHDSKTKMANRIGVNVITNLENLEMKFDVVIGNPPYQDPAGQNTIYPKFYAKAIEVCKPDGMIAMITPPAIIPGLWGVKNPDGIKMPDPIQIEKIKVGNVVKDFFPRVASDFCYFILKNVTPDNGQITVITDSGEVIASGPIFPREATNVAIAQSILNKAFSFYKDPYKATSGDHGKSAKFDPNGTEFAVEAISTSGEVRTRPVTWNKPHDHFNKPKVIMPMYGKIAVVDYSHRLVSAAQEKTSTGKLTGHNVMTVLTKSDFESESLVQILDSRIQRFFNSVTCETRSPYVNFLKNFVGVPLNKKYSDDDLEDVLGLDDSEKEWIRANF